MKHDPCQQDADLAVSKTRRLRLIAVIAVVMGVVILTATLLGVKLSGTPTDGTPIPTTTTAKITTTTLPPTTTATATPTTTTTAQPTVPEDSQLILVNAWNPLTKDEIAQTPLVAYSEHYSCHPDALEPLKAMLKDGARYGLYVVSAYRTYNKQESLYENKVQRVINAEGCSYEDALDIAATVVARPGTSEHHTGLAIDFLHKDCNTLEEYWDQSEAFDWLVAHCHEYGFILRYPQNKQAITGVIYEPWHYRYVGVEAATEIMERGITLEEYLTEKGLS